MMSLTRGIYFNVIKHAGRCMIRRMILCSQDVHVIKLYKKHLAWSTIRGFYPFELNESIMDKFRSDGPLMYPIRYPVGDSVKKEEVNRPPDHLNPKVLHLLFKDTHPVVSLTTAEKIMRRYPELSDVLVTDAIRIIEILTGMESCITMTHIQLNSWILLFDLNEIIEKINQIKMLAVLFGLSDLTGTPKIPPYITIRLFPFNQEMTATILRYATKSRDKNIIIQELKEFNEKIEYFYLNHMSQTKTRFQIIKYSKLHEFIINYPLEHLKDRIQLFQRYDITLEMILDNRQLLEIRQDVLDKRLFRLKRHNIKITPDLLMDPKRIKQLIDEKRDSMTIHEFLREKLDISSFDVNLMLNRNRRLQNPKVQLNLLEKKIDYLLGNTSLDGILIAAYPRILNYTIDYYKQHPELIQSVIRYYHNTFNVNRKLFLSKVVSDDDNSMHHDILR